ASRTLTVSFLADHQDDVSARFATSGIDRFADGGWSRLPTGEPVIDGALSWVRGRVVQRTPVGDSYLVSLRALASSVGDDARHEATATRSPLVYHDRTYHRIGDHSALSALPRGPRGPTGGRTRRSGPSSRCRAERTCRSPAPAARAELELLAEPLVVAGAEPGAQRRVVHGEAREPARLPQERVVGALDREVVVGARVDVGVGLDAPHLRRELAEPELERERRERVRGRRATPAAGTPGRLVARRAAGAAQHPPRGGGRARRRAPDHEQPRHRSRPLRGETHRTPPV